MLANQELLKYQWERQNRDRYEIYVDEWFDFGDLCLKNEADQEEQEQTLETR